MVIQETSEENYRILGDSEPETDCEPRETPSSAHARACTLSATRVAGTLSAEGDSFMPIRYSSMVVVRASYHAVASEGRAVA